MNKPFSPALAVALTAPLLAVVIAVPAGLDEAISPIAAGGLPLAWAALVAIAARLNPRASAAAFATALPFSAYSLAAFGPRPSLPWLLAFAAAAVAAVTVAGYGQAAPARVAGRLHSALRMIIGAAPGLAIARYSSPWSGLAVSALIAAVSLLALERRRR
ncbi:MAG: hypothetical protein A2Y38_12640 [Spirochaetes bacterium GWB1_59_5]|nr:MAG: hypothetical protein A2Y38_12640 [Spirochaetes bacterium GWB1_59_5]